MAEYKMPEPPEGMYWAVKSVKDGSHPHFRVYLYQKVHIHQRNIFKREIVTRSAMINYMDSSATTNPEENARRVVATAETILRVLEDEKLFRSLNGLTGYKSV